MLGLTPLFFLVSSAPATRGLEGASIAESPKLAEGGGSRTLRRQY
jgi:hypothetical protein